MYPGLLHAASPFLLLCPVVCDVEGISGYNQMSKVIIHLQQKQRFVKFQLSVPAPVASLSITGYYP
jgi:hypothetical protein